MPAIFSIGRVERTRPHLLADTAELAILFGGYSQVSESDLASIIRQSPSAAADLLPLDQPDIDDDGMPDGLGGAELNARELRYIEECFRQIEFRVRAFDEFYPFDIKEGCLTLHDTLTDEHFLYIFLVACARTRSFGRQVTNRLANEFEGVCAVALAKMVAPTAAVIKFGPEARRQGGDFSTNLIEAIPVLAERMGCDLARNWEKNLAAQGDGKIDLVAIFPFDRFSKGYHVIIAQCASMEDEASWNRKRQEAKSDFLRGFFHSLVDAQAALFIPACFRQSDGSWVDDNDVSGVIVIDRLRIVDVMRNQASPLFEPRAVVADVLGHPAPQSAA